MDKTLQDAIMVANHHGLTDRDLAAVVEAATVARRAEGNRPGLVPMTHPGQPGQSLRVHSDAVPMYEQSGWEVAADTSFDAAPEVKTKATAKPKKDEETP